MQLSLGEEGQQQNLHTSTVRQAHRQTHIAGLDPGFVRGGRQTIEQRQPITGILPTREIHGQGSRGKRSLKLKTFCPLSYKGVARC